MDDHEFDTICLDSNICDICNQDTGEELINCILNDRCLKVGDGTNSTLESTEPFKQAHKYCLDRWKSVIQSTLQPKCPSPKRSWKDKFKDLLNRNLENTSNFDAWVEVDNLKSTTETTTTTTQFLGDSSTQSSSDINENSASITTKKNSFLTREEYRVEQLNVDIEECRERGRKLRVRSVDIEDEDESPSNNHYGKLEREEKSWTKEQLGSFACKELLEIYKRLKTRIEETSTLLVSELEEKDSLRQQHDSLNATVGQLVQLQQKQNIKTLSLQFEQHQQLTAP